MSGWKRSEIEAVIDSKNGSNANPSFSAEKYGKVWGTWSRLSRENRLVAWALQGSQSYIILQNGLIFQVYPAFVMAAKHFKMFQENPMRTQGQFSPSEWDETFFKDVDATRFVDMGCVSNL